MNSFERYLNKQSRFAPYINDNHISSFLDKIIVIPCYNEKEIPDIVISLSNLEKPKGFAEVILVLNSSEHDSADTVLQNKKTEQAVSEWIKNNKSEHLKFHVINLENIPKKHAGVGYARKFGMDEAIRRFSKICKHDGIIISLDADCTVESNYLTAIEQHYAQHPLTNGTSVYFEHSTSGNEFSTEVYNAVYQYELHLRYYLQALRYTLYPYAFHTVGSCFTVSANAYVKQGGMNKRQGGEEFYFLQKIIPLKNYHEINNTKVYPSPRPSNRVPFGTGPYVNKIINSENVFNTYNVKAFENLRIFFSSINKLYETSAPKYPDIYNALPYNIKEFVSQNEFIDNLTEIKNNTGAFETFTQRFFKWFNAFKILKFLNYTHETVFEKTPVHKATEMLLNKIATESNSNNNLLKSYRSLELNSRYSV